MKLTEILEHLTNLKDCGYGDYEVKVRNYAGNYFFTCGFSVDVDNKDIRIY